MPGKELDRITESKAAELAVRYAGFVTVDSLSNTEKVMSLVSLIPMALDVVDEARDTIERLNDENSRIAAALELHQKESWGGKPWCMTCSRYWPCKTYSILTGDTPA